MVRDNTPTYGGAEGDLDHHQGGEEAVEEVLLGVAEDEDDNFSQEPQLKNVLGKHGSGVKFKDNFQSGKGTKEKRSLQPKEENIHKLRRSSRTNLKTN